MGPSEGAAMGQKGEIEDRPLPISVNHDPTDLIMLHACLELLPNLSPAQNTGIFVFFFFFFLWWRSTRVYRLRLSKINYTPGKKKNSVANLS